MINPPNQPSQPQQVFFGLATRAVEAVRDGDPLAAWTELEKGMAGDAVLRAHCDTVYRLYHEAAGDAQAWKQGLDGIMRLL